MPSCLFIPARFIAKTLTAAIAFVLATGRIAPVTVGCAIRPRMHPIIRATR
jgi:hypothetical protein